MQNKSLEEWIKFYEQKTGVKYEETDKRAKRYYFADKGFAEIGLTKDMAIIHQLCGEAKFWKNVAEVLAQEHGLNHLGTWIIRNVEAYIKLFGIEIECIEELGAGLKRYHGRLKGTGKPAIFTPHFKAKNGNVGYLVTWEI